MTDGATVLPGDYKDRRTGLIIFGVFLILLGAFCGLAVPLVVFGALISSTVPNSPQITVPMLLPSIAMYGFMALAFSWLGIGSIQCRRWARALILIISTLWLIIGIEATIATMFIMPDSLASTPSGRQLPAGMLPIVLAITLVMDTVIFIVFPLSFVLFYRSRHVRTTCDVRDPVERWTDRCPMPVLALCLLFGISAAYMPLMIFSTNSAAPFFGMYVNGIPGAVIYLISAFVMGYCTYACYNLQIKGWWTAFIWMSIWMLNSGITIGLRGILGMYEAMNMPAVQFEHMKQMHIFQGPFLWIMMLAGAIPYIGFILYTKRYFKGSTIAQ